MTGPRERKKNLVITNLLPIHSLLVVPYKKAFKCEALTMKREINRGEAAQQMDGAEILGPGAWKDKDGSIHFSVPDILAYVQLPDTPENRTTLEGVIRDFIAAAHPGAQVIEQKITDNN